MASIKMCPMVAIIALVRQGDEGRREGEEEGGGEGEGEERREGVKERVGHRYSEKVQ